VRRALTFFQHPDDQLFDSRIELSVRSLPAHRIIPSWRYAGRDADDYASPEPRA
jgi:hypothetical protein